jgi:hypothetical protein
MKKKESWSALLQTSPDLLPQKGAWKNTHWRQKCIVQLLHWGWFRSYFRQNLKVQRLFWM